MKEMRSRKRANPTTQCGKCGTELTAQTAYKREWRGVLCSRCNTGLGMFRDNPKLLHAAAEYLDNPPGLTALPHRPAVVESLAGAA